ncbi:hypothetical protein ANO11243_011250 [Dothideomycetidae sp. 11243]|nr:hypothetical protein ANO11243_011250 [fungal sp. No.11243]
MSSNNPFRRLAGKLSHHNDDSSTTYSPPPGPPPSKADQDQTFDPPAGPPPSHQAAGAGGPPHIIVDGKDASTDAPPPSYEPWFTVPDNSSLPPPPSLGYDSSPTANASEELAREGREWTAKNPPRQPGRLSPGQQDEVLQGKLHLDRPPHLKCSMKMARPGNVTVKTSLRTPDTVLVTTLPMYSALRANPGWSKRPYTIYFEIKIISLDLRSTEAAEVGSAVAIGFGAAPYPSFRLPGWERASLGVHSDDGRRYINDNCGGHDFTTAFQEGEVVGIGMTMRPSPASLNREWGKNQVECFLTREGQKAGSWNLWEERDANDGDLGDPVGLGGDRDLHGMVGLFGAVEFEFRANKDEWLYRPDTNWDAQGHDVPWMS